MKQRTSARRRLVTTGAASVGVIAIAATAAFAHIPGAGNGQAPSTNGPDLRTVAVVPYDLNDGATEKARFCFDSALETLSASPGATFAIQTYDARRAMNPVSVAKATDDAKCLIASFASGTDLAQGTVGEVVPGAVADVSNRINDYASEPLGGSVSAPSPGATTGPDLVSAVPDTSDSANKIIVYTFDENIDPAPATAYSSASFGFYNSAGVPVAGTGAVTISANKATVNFGAVAGPEAATRFFANAGAVQDRPQTAALPAGTSLSTPSSPGFVATAASPRPTIAGVTVLGPQSFKVTFTQAVSFVPAGAAGFIAVSDDGTAPAAATTLGTGGDAASVIATFPASVSADPASIVKILVAPGSVTAASDGTTTNAADEKATSTPNAAPGFTNGPDLLAVGVDTTLNRVVYKYDENVIADTPPPASAFRATAADGTVIASTGGVIVTNNLVIANYPSTISTAVSFSNPFGTVTDRTGRPNPHQSVSNALEAAPGVTTPPPPIVVPKIAPTAKSTISIKRTIKRRGTKRVVFSGKVRSTFKGCTQKRTVVLKRKGSSKRYGTAKTNSKGNYTIRRSRHVKGKVYAFALAGTSGGVKCSSAKSRSIRG